MRFSIAAALLVVCAATAASAQAPGPDQVYDIPPGSKDQSVILLKRDFKPGESAGPHIHHGVEITQVLSGTFEITQAGKPPLTVKAGGSFLVPREVPHDAKNVGSETGKLAITFVVDKGSALRSPVDASLLK
jgi:quercetin dioxygenase-like cupin family protein